MRFPHDLQEEFPELNGLIERLIKTNYEFGRLAAAYDEVNRHIWRVESEEEPTTDEALEKLKKRRLLLKDDIATLLTKERGPDKRAPSAQSFYRATFVVRSCEQQRG